MESNGLTLLASTTEPTIVVSGAVEPSLLSDILAATQIVNLGDLLTLDISSLPTGYSVLVQPQVHAADTPLRPTLTNQARDVSINEVSDWVNPGLSAAATGADYTTVTVAGQPAWTGRIEFNPIGTLTFLVWSPRPGVVIEITTTNRHRTTAELIQLAEATTVIPSADWHELYG